MRTDDFCFRLQRTAQFLFSDKIRESLFVIRTVLWNSGDDILNWFLCREKSRWEFLDIVLPNFVADRNFDNIVYCSFEYLVFCVEIDPLSCGVVFVTEKSKFTSGWILNAISVFPTVELLRNWMLKRCLNKGFCDEYCERCLCSMHNSWSYFFSLKREFQDKRTWARLIYFLSLSVIWITSVRRQNELSKILLEWIWYIW